MSDIVTVGGKTGHAQSAVSCIIDESGSPIPVVSETARIPILSEETDLALGLVSTRRIVNKFGRNVDVDTATSPEDIWDGGGLYTGFPESGAAETLSVFSSSASDSSAGTGARTLRIQGLDSSYNEIAETVTLNGTTPVSTISTFWRVHTSHVLTSGSAVFNVGEITIRHSTTTANKFLVITANRNQSASSGYTIPAGYTGVIKRHYASIRAGIVAVSADGDLWVRQLGTAPRLRRPWTANNTNPYYSAIYGGLVLPEKTDFIVRCSTVSQSNLDIITAYDIELILN